MENKKDYRFKERSTEKICIKKIKEDNKLNILNNKNIQKKIFIPNKLINIITLK